MSLIKEKDLTSHEKKQKLELLWHEDWYIHYTGQILHILNYEDDTGHSLAARLPSDLVCLALPKGEKSQVLCLYIEDADEIQFYRYERDIHLGDLERILGQLSREYDLKNINFFQQPPEWERVDGHRCLVISIDEADIKDETKIHGFLDKTSRKIKDRQVV